MASQRFKYLGVLYDTVAWTAELPEDKVLLLVADMELMLAGRKVTRRFLERLVGRMAWASGMLYGGRTFTRRLLDQMKELKMPWHRARVSASTHADLVWWLRWLPCSEIRRSLVDLTMPATDYWLETDASFLGGAWVRRGRDGRVSDWEHWTWDFDVLPAGDSPVGTINLLELAAIVRGLEACESDMSDCWLEVRSDNAACVAWINKGSARSEDPRVMSLLRALFGLCIRRNARVTARHLPGLQNVLADALSRFRFSEFAAIAFPSEGVRSRI